MNVNALKALDSNDLAALIAMSQDYRDGLRWRTITGTGQGVTDELADVDALIAKLQAAL